MTNITLAQRAALIEAVREASRAEILPRFRTLGRDEITAKTGPEDLVTEADRRAEVAIGAAAARILPGAAIIGEEAVENDPALLDLINSSDYAVIIDPVDGTWNFAKGLSVFGVILAVAFRGETVFGLLYDPVMDDWIEASKGEGASYSRPGANVQPVRVSERRPLGRTHGYLSLHLFPKTMRRNLAAKLTEYGRVTSLRCSCHEYRMIGQGSADFCLSASVKPWDHAAGALIVEEAGGVARLVDGRPYRPGVDRKNQLLTANSEQLWDEVRSDLLSHIS